MTQQLRVRTNKRWRNFLYRNEVPPKILAREFDWLGEDDDFQGFFWYRGCWYHIDQFMRCPPVTQQEGDPFKGWHGYHADSYFSGVVVKISSDNEQYQIGTYTC